MQLQLKNYSNQKILDYSFQNQFLSFEMIEQSALSSDGEMDIFQLVETVPEVLANINGNMACIGLKGIQDVATNDMVKGLEKLKQEIGRLSRKHNFSKVVDMIVENNELKLVLEGHNQVSNQPIGSNKEEVNESKPTLLLIDLHNLISKCYHATKFKDDGPPDNKGLYFFMKSLFRLIDVYKPSHLAVASDRCSKSTWRKKLFPDYKAGRTSDEELKALFPIAIELLQKMNINCVNDKEYEADDFIRVIKDSFRKEVGEDAPIYIASSDKDLHQLLDKNTFQLFKQQGKREEIFTEKNFNEKYGISVNQWVLAKSLMGDSSDAITGCPGVGPKIIPALKEYKIYSLDDLYQNQILDKMVDSPYKRYVKKLLEGKESVLLSYKLASLSTEVNGFNPNVSDYKLAINRKVMVNQFKELGFEDLIGIY